MKYSPPDHNVLAQAFPRQNRIALPALLLSLFEGRFILARVVGASELYHFEAGAFNAKTTYKSWSMAMFYKEASFL